MGGTNPFCSSPVIMETVAAATSSISTFIVLLGVFLPEIAILSGFISDLMNVRVRHMPTSAFGVIAAILNWAVALLIGPKPENASFFSLPSRNSVSPTSSPEAAALSKVSRLFSPPDTLLGVASPLGSRKSTTSGPSGPTNTVRQAAVSAIAAVAPTPVAAPAPAPAPAAAAAPTPDDEDDRVTVEFSRNRRKPAASYASQSQSQKGGSKLADMVNDRFNPCAVRGLGTFDVSKRPMGIAVLTTIFFIYLLDMSVNKKRSTNEQISYWAVGSAILGVNIYAYWTLGCADSILSVAVPLIIGLIVGGSAFAIYQKLGPSYLPMDAQAPSSSTSSGVTPTGEYSACAAGNGGDFVCDAYLNGERIGTVGGAK
jgi:hypothetical protein